MHRVVQVAALQAEAKDSENEAERQKLQLEEAREEGDRLHGQIVEVGGLDPSCRWPQLLAKDTAR
jgi:hypothetical protein